MTDPNRLNARSPGESGESVDVASATDRARSSLAQDTHDYQAVLHSLADGVVVVDLEGKILFSNEAAARMVGIDALNVPPDRWTEAHGWFLPDEVTPYPLDQLPLIRAMKAEEVRDVEVFVRNDDVSTGALLSINGTPLRDEAGVIQGGVIVFRDITEKRKTSELVQRLSNAVEQTADSVIISRNDGEIEYVNPAFEKTTGYTLAEVLGKTPRILKSGAHDATAYEELWSTVLAGETYQGTFQNKKKCGEIYHAENTITPMKDEAGNITHLVSVVKDITERRKGEQQDLELHLAREVQRRLFPKADPRVPGFDIAGASFPAGAMGGDYFDFFPMLRDRLGIVIGDVSGHGLGPSLLMAQTRAYLRSLARTCSDIGEIASILNQALVEDTADASFVTLLFTCLDPADGSLDYVNAGHLPGFILDHSGSVRAELKSTSVPVGLFPHRVFESSQTVKLKPGDLVVLFTDGITESEAPDETSFGVEGVLEVVRAHRDEPSGQIVGKLCLAARQFTKGRVQLDDATAVILKADRAV